MREIKFRVWNKDYKVMGSAPVIKDGKCLKIVGIEIWGTSDDYILMQNTGLKDANGKEIYEGDIVKVKKHINMQDIYEVVWNKKIACFEYEDGPYMDEYGNVQPGIHYPNECIVIGNIYENPELLN